MKRWDIMNLIINKFNYQTYLEIGVHAGITFGAVQAKTKHGVDPDLKSAATHKIASDDFFKQLGPKDKYDIIFIDGLHEKTQVLRDFDNSLKHLSENGTIIFHDCNPLLKINGTFPQAVKRWNGTVWEAVIVLRQSRPDLSFFTINADQGCAVVRRGSQTIIPYSEITWEYFDKNRKQILNLISIDEFNQWIGS